MWLKKGAKQQVGNVSDLSILLDLGALDNFEMLASLENKVVVLTEDTKYNKLKLLLEANGFVQDKYFIQPLHGVDNVSAAMRLPTFSPNSVLTPTSCYTGTETPFLQRRRRG